MDISTPWGRSHNSIVIAPGITRHFAAGHGGTIITLSKIDSAPPAGAAALLKIGLGDPAGAQPGLWFEEDLAWCVPVVVFEADYRAWIAADPESENGRADALLRSAHETFLDAFPEDYEAVTGIAATPQNSRAMAEAQFKREHADGWMVYRVDMSPAEQPTLVVQIVRVKDYFSGADLDDSPRIEMPRQEYAELQRACMSSKVPFVAVDPRNYRLVDREDRAFVMYHNGDLEAGAPGDWAQLWREGDEVNLTLNQEALSKVLDAARAEFARALNVPVDAVRSVPVAGSRQLISLSATQPLGDIAEIKRVMGDWLADAWGSVHLQFEELQAIPDAKRDRPREAA